MATAVFVAAALAACGGSTTETQEASEASTTSAASPTPAASTSPTAAPSPSPEPTTSPTPSASGATSSDDVYAMIEDNLAAAAPEDLADVCDGLDLFGAEALVAMALGESVAEGADIPADIDAERLEQLFEGACANTAESSEDTGDDGGGEPAAIGEMQTVGDYEVTLTAFERDGTDAVMGMNEFNDEPENGAYATAEFEVTYVGDEEGDPAWDLAYVVVADARQVSDSDSDCTTDPAAFDVGTLENGGTATFVECFDVDPATIERLFVEELISFDDESRRTWDVS